MIDIEIRDYVDSRNRAPFEEWLLGLDRQAQAKLVIALSRLERGNTSNVEAVGEGVAELKLNWGLGYRVYFGKDGAKIVILVGGGTRARQSQDVATAKARWADYKARKVSLARSGD